MPTLLQLNTTLNYGSTGKIAEGIGLLAKSKGWRSVMAHGPRMKNPSQLETIQTNSNLDEKVHGAVYSLLLDKHGLGSKAAIRRFVEYLKTDVKPDIIHLHNIHGYYLNYEVLFDFLKSIDVPIVWTLHDCWTFTGHCTYFDAVGCDKWKSECHDCPQLKTYPTCIWKDNSRSNFELKKRLFTDISDRITLVPVSHFLEGYVKESFLKNCNSEVIHNGINLEVFRPNPDAKTHNQKKIILGVAAPWTQRKGLPDFIKLRDILPQEEFEIRLIGLSKKQVESLPSGIVGIERTQNVDELVKEYSQASVFVNPTYEDNYPTTNLEAIACGTPVITYLTGGSPESLSENTGLVVEKGDINGIETAIKQIISSPERFSAQACRAHAEGRFDASKQFQKYLDLYDRLLSKERGTS